MGDNCSSSVPQLPGDKKGEIENQALCPLCMLVRGASAQVSWGLAVPLPRISTFGPLMN